VKAATLARLALAGTRTDMLRVALTVVSAFLATLFLLAALTLSLLELRPRFPIENGYMYAETMTETFQYSNPFLVDNGAGGILLLTLYLLAGGLLALAGQCVRLGTPARDRRLAAVRLAGATPGQALLIVLAETGVAALLGSAVGGVAFGAVHRALHRPAPDGQLPWPTDVVLPVPLWAAAVLLPPALAAAVGMVLLRRVIVTPLGVVRRTVSRPPRLWPGLIVVGAVALAALVPPVATWIIDVGGSMHLVPTEFVVAGVAAVTIAGLVAVTGRISYATGRLLRRFGRGPAAVLAAGRLTSDPWHASRSGAALLATVIIGAGVFAFRERTLAEAQLQAEVHRQGPEFVDVETALYIDDPELVPRVMELGTWAVALGTAIAAAGVLVALAESLTARRRTHVSQVAAGVPRSTLVRAMAWQLLAPLTVALALGLGLGAGLMRLISGRVVEAWALFVTADGAVDRTSSWPVAVPFGDLLLLGAGTFAAMLVVVGGGALLLRTTTDIEELRVS
jgi:hypothetical protein